MGRFWFRAALGALLLLTLWGRREIDRATAPPPMPEKPQRIVSLAPSVTETLYALGMGKQVVGVTQYCEYPPEAKTKPRVAGFADVNYEAVLRLRPDLVILPADKTANRLSLEYLGLRTLALDTRTISGLLDALRTLGAAAGHEDEAAALLRRIRYSMDAAARRAAGRKAPRVLFSVMHSHEGLGYITEINAVGRDGFFDELIRMAGGENVYAGGLSFPRLSREAVIFLNPEVIVDVIPAVEDLAAVRRDWESLATVSAVKNGRLLLLTDEAATVPGPRFTDTLDTLSIALYPGPDGSAGKQ